jgi:uncharacterized protein (TIGR00730 family)
LPPKRVMNLTVYLGSSVGTETYFSKAAEELGRSIGLRGDTLVYGGSNTGLMGVLASAVRSSGGSVIGIQLNRFREDGLLFPDLTELQLCETMEERKKLLREQGDAYIAVPGGTGTLEESADTLSALALDGIRKPFIFLNLRHYFDPLKAQFETMFRFGFSQRNLLPGLRFAASVKEAFQILDTMQ